MKRFFIMLVLLCFAFNVTVFSAERVGYELYVVWDVGQIIPLRPNCDISYTILNDNGVAEYIQEGEFKGGIIFKKPGNTSADLLTQIENDKVIFRYNYRIVPKGTIDIETMTILNFINAHRAMFDFGIVELNNELCESCKVRAKELSSSFSHIRPNGTDYATAISNNSGVLGEVIGMTVEDAGNPYHDYNKICRILIDENLVTLQNRQFKEIGIGRYYDASEKRCYWVVLFSSK